MSELEIGNCLVAYFTNGEQDYQIVGVFRVNGELFWYDESGFACGPECCDVYPFWYLAPLHLNLKELVALESTWDDFCATVIKLTHERVPQQWQKEPDYPCMHPDLEVIALIENKIEEYKCRILTRTSNEKSN